ncbi:kynureninase [Betaproteobacteria bacterium GR16-43]|nr:kynureninase [Betaproteobacteria bacterium GR16-43]
MPVARHDLEALDRADALRDFRSQFELPPGVIYLDGNSLGALSRRSRERVAAVVEGDWGRGLIRSWDDAGWIEMPRRTGDKIARLIGAGQGEVVATDSTSVNLFKVLSVALRVDPKRRVILSERSNFPTDLHVAQGLATQLTPPIELMLVEGTEDAIEAALIERGSEIGVVHLTHVHYCTARMYDMARVTRAAHKAGAVVVWDLSHSAGVVALDVAGCEVDFAVGCGYKHLNGGPGAPAYLYVARRWQERFSQPISGWMGDAQPFAFRASYEPAPGISRYLSGTPPVLAMAALEASVEVILEAPMDAIRRKSVALCDLFIELMDRRCGGMGLELVTARESAWRGSHVSYRHAESEAAMRALIAQGVIGDCRPPDLMRFGFAPLYLRYVDVWDAVERIAALSLRG